MIGCRRSPSPGRREGRGARGDADADTDTRGTRLGGAGSARGLGRRRRRSAARLRSAPPAAAAGAAAPALAPALAPAPPSSPPSARPCPPRRPRRGWRRRRPRLFMPAPSATSATPSRSSPRASSSARCGGAEGGERGSARRDGAATPPRHPAGALAALWSPGPGGGGGGRRASGRAGGGPVAGRQPPARRGTGGWRVWRRSGECNAALLSAGVPDRPPHRQMHLLPVRVPAGEVGGMRGRGWERARRKGGGGRVPPPRPQRDPPERPTRRCPPTVRAEGRHRRREGRAGPPRWPCEPGQDRVRAAGGLAVRRGWRVRVRVRLPAGAWEKGFEARGCRRVQHSAILPLAKLTRYARSAPRT